jgi:hypothetical protein
MGVLFFKSFPSSAEGWLCHQINFPFLSGADGVVLVKDAKAPCMGNAELSRAFLETNS